MVQSIILEFNLGIPASAHGLDWAAAYFVNFFVAGKFWTIFLYCLVWVLR